MKVVQAAEHNNHELNFIAKLKSALFYVIDREHMTNWDLRKIYDALGGDPRKRGRKKAANLGALNEFLSQFPEPKNIQAALIANRPPTLSIEPPKAPPGPTTTKGVPSAQEPKPSVDKAKLGAATEKFIRTMESSTQSKTPRKIAAGASAEISALHASLGKKEVREAMTIDDQVAIMESITSMQPLLADCLKHLKKV